MVRVLRALVVLGIVTLSMTGIVVASPATNISDIASTRHNLSSAAGATTIWGTARNVQATGVVGQGTDQLCVFCHTPHGATIGLEAPLWNRSETGQFYAVYDSLTTDAIITQPAGTSKLCLSCHDGTVAVGTVNTIAGQADITMVTNAGFIDATGLLETTPATSGFSRYIGTDLSNDHPISFDYSSAMALTFDGELFAPPGPGTANIALRTLPPFPNLPLENTGSNTGDAVYQVQCGTCHDPHVRDSALTVSSKFLRLNRFQTATPSQGGFNENFDIICLACHDKEGWADSVHAVAAGSCSGTIVGKGCADETFLNVPAVTVDREFPVGMAVWQAACLNCHDTHTKEGSRRLLREGADANNKSAIENTCFQCHGATPIIDNPDGDLPDIETEFLKGGVPGAIGAGGSRMPIYNLDQVAQDESEHEIFNADFQEDSPPIPSGSIGRHAECTDCHNPHRMLNNELADGTGPGDKPTHLHTSAEITAAGTLMHTNALSGALAGVTGVEPTWNTAGAGLAVTAKFASEGSAFTPNPASFVSSWTVHCGSPGDGATADCPGGPVTKEYQICLRCHSDYSYGSIPPDLAVSGGGTSTADTSLTKYTNQAIEFYPGRCAGDKAALDAGTCLVGADPANDLWEQGEAGPWGSGDYDDTAPADGFDDNASTAGSGPAINHRSWHPVMYPTGRTPAVRYAFADNWRPPFNMGVGEQTMYCSDCHGSDNDGQASSAPLAGEPFGPHGSQYEFLLRGFFGENMVLDTKDTGFQARSSDVPDNTFICMKCHAWEAYGDQGNAGNGATPYLSGWRVRPNAGAGCVKAAAPANLHLGHVGIAGGFRCSWCHAAVPHGWPNKQLLVNLPQNPNCNEGGGLYTSPCNDPPYYQHAFLGGNFDFGNNTPWIWQVSGDYVPETCGTQGWMTSTCKNKD